MSYPDIADLADVSAAVNLLPYKADPPDDDNWSPIDDSGGDCDSYAVAKLHRLRALGWPIAALRLALCYVETGEYHAVLSVDTDDGERILDNRFSHPCTLDELARIGYKPDRIQIEGGSRTWVDWKWKENGRP